MPKAKIALQSTVTIASRYDILRGVVSDNKSQIPLTEKPIMVMRLLNEDEFIRTGGIISHGKTVSIHDFGHDWDWGNGFLRSFACGGDTVDLVVCYEKQLIQKTMEPKFCYQCGIRLADHPGHNVDAPH